MDKHNGTLTFETEINKGTTFIVTLRATEGQKQF
jgi:signal transduction histidine kinase